MLGLGEQCLIIVILFYCLFSKLQIILATVACISVVLAYIWYLKYDKTYWTRKGLPTEKAHFFYGQTKEFNKNIHEYDLRMSKKYETYGSYIYGYKEFSSTNLNILRRVLIKDFDHFTDRYVYRRPTRRDRFSLMINTINEKGGPDWKNMRSAMSSAFTTGKIRKCMPIFKDCLKETIEYLDNCYVATQKEIPIKNVCEKLTLTMIGRTALGVDFNPLEDRPEDRTFLTYVHRIISLKYSNPIVVLSSYFPKIASMIRSLTGHQLYNNEPHSYLKNLLKHNLDVRRKDPDAPNKYTDMFQLLLNEYDKRNNDLLDSKTRDDKLEIREIDILASFWIILGAGFDTTSITLHFAIFHLSKLPHVQDRVREEVLKILGGRDDLDYDDLWKLDYLYQVIQECLRMYPSVPRYNRVCTKPIIIDGISIDEGAIFRIPLYAIHYNEEYYPNPYEFDPERFSPDAKSQRDPLTFLGFGAGPRMCIGMRFAEIELRYALAMLVKNHRILPSDKSPDLPLKVTNNVVMRPVEELYARLEKL